MTTRRGFITGLISFVAAPAIVRAGSLMQIKGMPLSPEYPRGLYTGTAADMEMFLDAVRKIVMPKAWRIMGEGTHYTTWENELLNVRAIQPEELFENKPVAHRHNVSLDEAMAKGWFG